MPVGACPAVTWGNLPLMNWNPPDSSPSSLWKNGVCDELALLQFITGGAHPPPKQVLLSPLPLERPGEGLPATRFATSLRNSAVPRLQLSRFQGVRKLIPPDFRNTPFFASADAQKNPLCQRNDDISAPSRNNQIGKEPFEHKGAAASRTQLHRALGE